MCLEDTKISYSFIKTGNASRRETQINAHAGEKAGERTECLKICVCDSQLMRTRTVSPYPVIFALRLLMKTTL